MSETVSTEQAGIMIGELRADNDRFRLLLRLYTKWEPDKGFIEPIQKTIRKPFNDSFYCDTCGRFNSECVCEHNQIVRALQLKED